MYGLLKVGWPQRERMGTSDATVGEKIADHRIELFHSSENFRNPLHSIGGEGIGFQREQLKIVSHAFKRRPECEGKGLSECIQHAI